MNLKKLLNNPLTYIIIASPFLLYAITLLLPVHDDWSYCTTPYYDFGESLFTESFHGTAIGGLGTDFSDIF